MKLFLLIDLLTHVFLLIEWRCKKSPRGREQRSTKARILSFSFGWAPLARWRRRLWNRSCLISMKIRHPNWNHRPGKKEKTNLNAVASWENPLERNNFVLFQQFSSIHIHSLESYRMKRWKNWALDDSRVFLLAFIERGLKTASSGSHSCAHSLR